MSLAGLLDGMDQPNNNKLSWRPPAELSDWELRVGEKTYRVHKSVCGADERRCQSLRDAFDQSMTTQAVTNLSVGDPPYVPAACEQYFESVLDFVYFSMASKALTIFSIGVRKERRMNRPVLSFQPLPPGVHA